VFPRREDEVAVAECAGIAEHPLDVTRTYHAHKYPARMENAL
jgi:hypothetical protein